MGNKRGGEEERERKGEGEKRRLTRPEKSLQINT